MDAVTYADDGSVAELVEQFAAGVVSPTGPDGYVAYRIVGVAPTSSWLAPRLLEVLPQASGKGRDAVFVLAAQLAADAGYRPVAEAAAASGSLAGVDRMQLVHITTELDRAALAWWLDLVDADPSTVAAVTPALTTRVARRGDEDPTPIVEHLLRTDRGPDRDAAHVLAAVLARHGTCPPLERMLCRWIEEGRFDGLLDEVDGRIDAGILGMCLQTCLTEGGFTVAWEPVASAIEHWRGLLGAADAGQRRRGLHSMAALIFRTVTVGDLLPGAVAGVLPSESPERSAVERGFAAVAVVITDPDHSGRSEIVAGQAYDELLELARRPLI